MQLSPLIITKIQRRIIIRYLINSSREKFLMGVEMHRGSALLNKSFIHKLSRKLRKPSLKCVLFQYGKLCK